MKENKFLEKKRHAFKLFNVDKKTNSNIEKFTINIENDKEDEFDYCQKSFRDKISKLCNKFSNFNSDYTYYCYNNLKELKNNKEFNEEIRKVIENNNNKELFKEILDFINKREIIIENILSEEKNILSKEENKDKKWYFDNIRDKINSNSNNTNEISGETRFSDDYNDLKKDEQEEIFVASLIDCSFEKMKKIEEDFDTSINKNIDINININYEIKIEAQNFNFQESSLIAFFSGIKFNNNIKEINLNGNELTPKSCFCLGNLFKYHKHLDKLSLMRCNLNNLCLKLFVIGATHNNEDLNRKPIYIDHLILKDNDQINDEDNNNEYSLSLIIEKFVIKILNLANTKIGGNGLKKICRTFLKLLNDDDKNIALENLNLFNIGIQNEEN